MVSTGISHPFASMKQTLFQPSPSLRPPHPPCELMLYQTYGSPEIGLVPPKKQFVVVPLVAAITRPGITGVTASMITSTIRLQTSGNPTAGAGKVGFTSVPDGAFTWIGR